MHLSEGDGYETVDAEVDDTSGLEGEEEDSFVDIDDIPGTKSDLEGGIRGTSMVGRRVEVVTKSGRRAVALCTVNDVATGAVHTPVKYVIRELSEVQKLVKVLELGTDGLPCDVGRTPELHICDRYSSR